MEYGETIDKVFLNKKLSATLKRIYRTIQNAASNDKDGTALLDPLEVQLWKMKEELSNGEGTFLEFQALYDKETGKV